MNCKNVVKALSQNKIGTHEMAAIFILTLRF